MDILVGSGWELPDLSRDARAKVKSIIGEKTPVEIQNPIDLTGPGFVPENYLAVLETVLKEDFDAYLLVWGNYNPHISMPVAQFEKVIKKYPDKAVVLSLMGDLLNFAPTLADLTSAGLCAYLAPEDGATALNALLARRHFLKREEM
jgi:acyl-CoA synthetase (NDP forming)